MELRSYGYHHYEIAEKMREEFNLDHVPSVGHICEMISRGRA